MKKLTSPQFFGLDNSRSCLSNVIDEENKPSLIAEYERNFISLEENGNYRIFRVIQVKEKKKLLSHSMKHSDTVVRYGVYTSSPQRREKAVAFQILLVSFAKIQKNVIKL